MAAITTFDGFLARIGNKFWRDLPIESRTLTNTTLATAAPNNGSGFIPIQKLAATYTIPSLESGVTAYIPLRAIFAGAATTVLCARGTNLGSLNLGTNTFTDGSAMPTVTELNASAPRSSPVVIECTTATDGNAATITITYVDQDGNTAETSPSFTLTTAARSAGDCCMMGLNSPDWGVRDITAAARASGTKTGVIKFWGLEPICMFNTGPSGTAVDSEDWIMQALNLFKLGAGDVITFFVVSAQAFSGNMTGQLFFVGDS